MKDIEKIGLIPAAGRGIRMGLPFPKELFPVMGNDSYLPIAHFSVDRILRADIHHIVFVINETKHQLIEYFGSGDEYNCHFSYVVQGAKTTTLEGSTSPGLAHALDAAHHLTRNKNVYFAMADTMMHPADVFKIAEQSAPPDADVILCLFKTDHPEKFGMVSFEEASGKVNKIIDKPAQTALIWMWGSIIWGPEFTEFLHQKVLLDKMTDFATIMNQAIAAGVNFNAVCFKDGNYIDIGTYDDARTIFSVRPRDFS